MVHVSCDGQYKISYYARARAFGRVLSAIAIALFVTTAVWAESPRSSKSQKKATFVSTPDLNSSKSTDRLEALESDKKSRRLSQKALRDRFKTEKDPVVRYRLNQAIAQTDTPDVAVSLIDSLNNDSDELVRKGAAQNLGQFAKNSDVSKALAEALSKETVSSVRYAIALSLSLSESGEALAALETASRDADPKLRSQIAYGLHRNSSKKAGQILKKLRGDKDPMVRDVARKNDL